MPIMTINYKSLQNMIDFCEKNNFEFLSSPTIFPKNDGDESPTSLRLEETDLLETIKVLDGHTKFEKSEVHTADVPCTALLYSFSIDCLGDVYPCNSLYYKLGNVFESKIKDIWYDSEGSKYIKSLKNTDLKKCGSCNLKNECQRCPGMSLFDGDMLDCDLYAKKIACVRTCSSYNKVF